MGNVESGGDEKNVTDTQGQSDYGCHMMRQHSEENVIRPQDGQNSLDP